MITDDKIIELFCKIDDFMKEYEKTITSNSLSDPSLIKRRNRKSKLSPSEVMTILILFHLRSYRNLKHFYLTYICEHSRDLFPEVLSYNRFIELQKRVTQPLAVFMKMHCLGECSGISFIDSTALKVCHYKREKQNKVFQDIAQKSRGTMGWFFGFKLHLVCNDKGDLLEFMLTPGNIDDRFPLKQQRFIEKIFGKIYGDKGYIGADLFDRLFVDGIHLVTKVRKNMKKKAMEFMDRVTLRKRAIIESVNDVLKNTCYIEHTRHRSFDNFLNNMISGLIAYSLLPKKPSINIQKMVPNNGIA